MFYLVIFFVTKRGTWRDLSRDQSVECFSSFLKYLFCHNFLLFFSTILYTVLSCTELVGYTLNSRTHKLYSKNPCFYSPRGFPTRL